MPRSPYAWVGRKKKLIVIRKLRNYIKKLNPNWIET